MPFEVQISNLFPVIHYLVLTTFQHIRIPRTVTIEGNALQRYSAERSMAGKAAVLWAAHLGAYFQMGSDGHRRRDYDPDHPPVDPQFVVENTGIELSEAFAK